MAAVHDPGAVALVIVWALCGIVAVAIAALAWWAERNRQNRKDDR